LTLPLIFFTRAGGSDFDTYPLVVVEPVAIYGQHVQEKQRSPKREKSPTQK
jgi:hypothetical protein